MRRPSTGAFRTHCEVLELSTVGSVSQLTQAYRVLINRWHPDRHIGDPKAHAIALERAKAINAAYEYLSEILEAGLVPPMDTRSATPSSDGWRVATDAYQTRHSYQGQTYRTGFPDRSVIEVFVKSSNIVSVGFDRNNLILYIKFKGDRVYRYFDVAEQIFESFLAATSSHGKYANRHIYPHYRYERC
jgi:hypothetical protein